LTICSWILNVSNEPDGTQVEIQAAKSLQSVHFCQNVAVTDGFINIISRLMAKETNLEQALEELVPVEAEVAALQFHKRDYGERH